MDETKIVKMVLSNVSISVSSNFSTDLISTTSFRYVLLLYMFFQFVFYISYSHVFIIRYVKAPKPSKSQLDEAAAERVKKTKVVSRDSEEAAFGTYAGQGKQSTNQFHQIPLTLRE